MNQKSPVEIFTEKTEGNAFESLFGAAFQRSNVKTLKQMGLWRTLPYKAYAGCLDHVETFTQGVFQDRPDIVFVLRIRDR